MLASVILSGSKESDTLILFLQIFHFVQDDMTGFSDMCVCNSYPTLWEAFSLRMSHILN